MADRDFLAIGKIRTSHGVKGYVRIINFSGEKEHFFSLDEVSLESGTGRVRIKIEHIKENRNDILIKFAGIDTPEEAKKYINHEIWVPRENASVLREGEYYFADLCSCFLVTGDKYHGKVKSVIDGGAGNLLEVESPEKKVFLVPFRNEFIGEINIKLKTIELTAEWIIP